MGCKAGRSILIIVFFCHCLLSFTQIDLRNIEFTGWVLNEDNKGIAGVAVTDGLNVVATDSKGRYTLLSNATVGYIYITIPSGYTIPIENEAPYYFRKITDKSKTRQKIDFHLKKSARDDNRHTLIVWADPQTYFDENVPELQKAADDVQKLVHEAYTDRNVYGVVCGDIIGEIKTDKRFFDITKQMLNATNVPFFYLLGNHDMDLDVRTNDLSKKTFNSHFGPTYYSFNRGKVHYIVLDDVFFYAKGYGYIGYLEEKQLKWLEQDLALIPENSTVVVCCHIPTWSREARHEKWGDESLNKVMNNRRHLYELLKPYKVHIMSAHEHYNENYILSDNLYEHVHAAISGLFWQSYWNMDGTPSGYGVYEFDGDDVKWYYKAVGNGRDFQFNAYPVGANKEKPNSITANVWNYDKDWKVYWYENGVKQGEMQQYTGTDVTIYNDVTANRENYKFKYIGCAATEHMFFADPSSPDSEVKIEVIDPFGKVYIWANK